LFSLDGKEKMQIDKTVPIEEWKKLGFILLRKLNNGGTKLMTENRILKKIMSQTSILSTKTLSEEQRQVFLDANFDLLEQDFIEIKNNLFELIQSTTT
jgi:hypothetical protein